MVPTGIGVGATGVLLWGLGAVPQCIVGVTAQIQWTVGPNGYRLVPHWGFAMGVGAADFNLWCVTAKPLQGGNDQWWQWGIGVCATGGAAMGLGGSQSQFGQGNGPADTWWAPNWEWLQWVPGGQGLGAETPKGQTQWSP